MSATNHTTNYNLPQFIGADKPTWLTDVNGAFSTIDTNLKSVSDTATGANSTATTNASAIGTLSSLNTTNKTNLVSAVNEVNTNLGTTSSVASEASGKATTALTDVNALSSYLALTNTNALTPTTSYGNVEWATFNEAVNATGSLGKVYGTGAFKRTSSSQNMQVTIPTSFRPASAISNVTGIAWRQDYDGSKFGPLVPISFSLATNGNITFSMDSPYNQTVRVYFWACLFFAKDFGDLPPAE